MSDWREHVDFEELNDYVDGRLDEQAADRVAEHIARCADCRLEHRQLAELLAAASGAQRSIEPGEALWSDVRKAIEMRKEAVLPSTNSAPKKPSGKRLVGASPTWLAVAAMALIVVSSGITTIVLRRSPGELVDTSGSTPPARLVLPASFQAAELEYSRTIGELRIAVDAQRANLSPETIQTVDRSLAIIDSAISEARAALIADPNNRTLVDLLASSYQRKLDLLRRTSELSPKI